MEIFAIILARGGSVGIPKKNIYPINGFPLISYTIQQCLDAGINKIYTSSDSDEILKIASFYGSKIIKRPYDFSLNESTSEEAWIHAINQIKDIDFDKDWIFAPQVTSPLRHKEDLDKAFRLASSEIYDSIFSVVKFEDFFLWKDDGKRLNSINYDYLNRKRRQELGTKTLLENGSFYMFKVKDIIKNNNRLNGKIGYIEMTKNKMYQIDSFKDIEIVEYFIDKYKLNKNIKKY